MYDTWTPVSHMQLCVALIMDCTDEQNILRFFNPQHLKSNKYEYDINLIPNNLKEKERDHRCYIVVKYLYFIPCDRPTLVFH